MSEGMKPALLAGAALLLVAAAPVKKDPPFASVQPELLGMPGSLSNAWADFDNDGDLDLAVSLKSGEIRLYRNDKGALTSIGAAMGLPAAGGEFRALSWGDFDADGWIDLLAGSSLPEKPTAVFHNKAGKGFENVAAEIGLTIPGRASRQNNWIDYDNDGDLDLYATNRMGPNQLFRNDGGKFVQVFADGGPTVFRSTVGACWLDYDKDGDLDLFLANQSGKADSLYRNDGSAFVDVAPQLGMDQPARSPEDGGVGCAVGDYDNDGNLDLFVPNYGHNTLWRGDGKGGFANTAQAMGVGLENHAVGAAWGDYDNDGFVDLSVMSYEGPPNQQTPLDSLFHNDGGKGFTNVLTKGGPLDAGDHGVVWVDYDRDGALDLSVTRGYSPVGGHFLFRNLLPKAQARQSLQVTVLDAKGRFTQQGAEVRVYAPGGKLLGTGQVSTGGGYGAQGATPVHFGLPATAKVNVEVTFMSASGRKAQTVRNVDVGVYAGKALVVRRAP
ncbi:CRTAC1 family protein [Phenylobacterium sp.]|uniref:CRTAC1 family protein n=1 Tax=Phenylobacterium sp. TaxID=1871053 RepID=UPI003BA8CAC5